MNYRVYLSVAHIYQSRILQDVEGLGIELSNHWLYYKLLLKSVVTKELNAWCILDYWNLDISLFLNCSATVMIQSICLYHHEVTTMGSLLHWAEPKPNCSSWDMTRRSTIKTRLRVWVCSFCTLRFLRVALVGCPILCWDSEVALQISSVV